MTATAPSAGRARTEVVVRRSGAVRVNGHLTSQGADLLRGTVESMHRAGSSCVVVDLTGVRAADDAGLDGLRDLRESVARDGGRLLLCNLAALDGDHG